LKNKSEFINMLHNLVSLVYYSILAIILLSSCATPPPLPTPQYPSLSHHPQPTPVFNVIRLANGTWPPYNGPNLPHAGCDSWAITEAFALQGITVAYDFFPWARSYSLSATGEWDGSLAWADTPEHRTLHYISAEPVSIQEWAFFYRTDHPLVWNKLDDLAGKTIGVTTGYVYSDTFKDLRKKGTVNFVESSSDEANLKMLLAGRIDVFPMERRVGHYIINSIFTPQEQGQLSDSPRPFAQFRSFLLLSKAVPQNEQRMALFNSGFKRLQESGQYAKIMQSCAP
jgi:polar amino acid transport system substrate-binding protein